MALSSLQLNRKDRVEVGAQWTLTRYADATFTISNGCTYLEQLLWSV